jgi:undecaprenyl-diphosphatase
VSADPLLEAVVLGLVEGATEFIPVSSTGHLIVASAWLGRTGEVAKTFDIFIQLGAILAIVWLYRARLMEAVLAARSEGPSRRFLLNLLIAFLPAAVVGFLAHDWIKQHLFRIPVVAAALVVGGIVILLIERWRPRETVDRADAVPARTALGIGLAQVLSLVPGTSRSGATIMGGYVLGLSRRAATEFSFFLAIPVMLAATLYDLLKSLHALTTADAPAFVVGFVVSFLTALVVVKGFLAYVSRHSFTAFAWYRIVFGALLLLFAR